VDQRFYIAQLDGLRFIAFSLVFLHHLPVAPINEDAYRVFKFLFLRLHNFGWVGVELFFCLSAFLMTSLLLLEHAQKGRCSISSFYLRRVLRIWPLYFFAMLLGFVLFPLLSIPSSLEFGSHEYVRMVRQHLLPMVLFFGNVSAAINYYAPSPATAPLWTISSEEQFYLILPLVITALAGRSIKTWLWVLGGTSAFSLGVRIAFIVIEVKHPVVWVIQIAHMDSFLIGMLLALLWLRRSIVSWMSESVAYAALCLATLLFTAVALAPDVSAGSVHSIWQYPIVSLGFGLVLLPLCVGRPRMLVGLLSRKSVVWLGKISYGLYVYHLMAIVAVGWAIMWFDGFGFPGLAWGKWLAYLAISLALVVGVSAISYACLERPFLRLKAKFELVPSRAP